MEEKKETVLHFHNDCPMQQQECNVDLKTTGM